MVAFNIYIILKSFQLCLLAFLGLLHFHFKYDTAELKGIATSASEKSNARLYKIQKTIFPFSRIWSKKNIWIFGFWLETEFLHPFKIIH